MQNMTLYSFDFLCDNVVSLVMFGKFRWAFFTAEKGGAEVSQRKI